MIIIPLTGRLSRKNIPWITIGLILINTFVFFIVQHGERYKLNQAISYYLNSGLANIECPRYLQYLKERNTDGNTIRLREDVRLKPEELIRLYFMMQRDDEFMERLSSEKVITPDEPIYQTWKELRGNFKRLLFRIPVYRYGFIPAEPTPLSLISYMFLHGSFMHLLGNMIFLWLAGSVLESGWSRSIYLFFYVICGILACISFGLINSHSRLPLIGASGAISGLVGGMMVSYGTARIKIFYSFGFYFDYKRIPGLLLLPAWILKELFQLFFSSIQNIAFIAHIGGIIAGAGLGYLNVRVLKRLKMEVFDENTSEKTSKILEQALKRMENLDFNAAKGLLEEVLQIDPENRSALERLYEIEKHRSNQRSYHDISLRYLKYLSREPDDHEELIKVYREFIRTVKPDTIDLGLLYDIGMIFLKTNHLKEAESIMAIILKRDPEFKKLPAGLLRLGQGNLKAGNVRKASGIFRLIINRFPDSPESRIATQLIRSPKS